MLLLGVGRPLTFKDSNAFWCVSSSKIKLYQLWRRFYSQYFYDDFLVDETFVYSLKQKTRQFLQAKRYLFPNNKK